MRRGLILLFILGTLALPSFGQTETSPVVPENAILVDLVVRLFSGDTESVLWNTESSKLTVSGKAIRVKISGTDIIIVTNLTPYRKDLNTFILLAHAEVWIKDPAKEAVSYYSTFKTLEVPAGETVLFFPLGVTEEQDPSAFTIQIEIEIKPYISDPGTSGE